jgi:hypothetical protein
VHDAEKRRSAFGSDDAQTGFQRKVTLPTSTVANLTAQATALANADVNNILNASVDSLAPYATVNAAVTVSCLGLDATGKAIADWSATKGSNIRDLLDRRHPCGACGVEHAAPPCRSQRLARPLPAR